LIRETHSRGFAQRRIRRYRTARGSERDPNSTK